jgi:glutathione S-transferase
MSKVMQWTYNPQSAAWGTFEDVERTLRDALSRSPYLLGERFTVADVLISSSVQMGLQAKLLPSEAPFTAYTERIAARPAFHRALAKDAG